MIIQSCNNPSKKSTFNFILIDLHMPVIDGFQVRIYIILFIGTCKIKITGKRRSNKLK